MLPEYRKVIFPYINKDGSVTWVVEFPDLPGCSAVGATEDEALRESKIASDLWLDTYFEEHHSYPDPMEIDNSFSGKFVLRLPKTLHQMLAYQAEDEGVSLNALIVALISQNYGRRINQPSIEVNFSQEQPASDHQEISYHYSESDEEASMISMCC
jgi:antitoxin HicB